MPRNKRLNSFGDTVQDYGPDELIEMYLAEGKTQEDAEEKAEALFYELRRLNSDSKNIWRRARNR